jgi:hypothetical protein
MIGFGSSLQGFSNPSSYNSGIQDGNYPNPQGSSTGTGIGMPNFGNGAVVVAVIVILAVVLLIAGVVSLRAAGEVVI